jgi:ribosomal protein S18 acetylase RimI-like enzyme
MGGALWMAGSEGHTDCGDVDLSNVHLAALTPDDWRELRSVRLAAIADAPWAFLSDRRSENGWGEQEWRDRSQDGVWVVARGNGDVVGVARSKPDSETPGQCHIEALWVHPRYRRRGVATRLVAWLIRREMSAGIRDILVWVFESNEDARGLYEALGFRPTGERQVLAGEPGPRIEERLKLPLRVRRPGV